MPGRKQTVVVMGLLVAALMLPGISVAELKVAVIDIQRAVFSSEEAREYLAQIEEEFSQQEDEMRDLQTGVSAMQEHLQKDGEVLSDSERRRLQQDIESKTNDFVYLRQKVQRQVEDRQQELFSGMDGKVQRAVEELVRREDYDLVLHRQAVLYSGDLYDITRKLTEQLNSLDVEESQ